MELRHPTRLAEPRFSKPLKTARLKRADRQLKVIGTVESAINSCMETQINKELGDDYGKEIDFLYFHLARDVVRKISRG